jgi:hypothetical protein
MAFDGFTSPDLYETEDERFVREQNERNSILTPKQAEKGTQDGDTSRSGRTQNVMVSYRSRAAETEDTNQKRQRLPTAAATAAASHTNDNGGGSVFSLRRNKASRLKASAATAVNSSVVLMLYWPSAICSGLALMFLAIAISIDAAASTYVGATVMWWYDINSQTVWFLFWSFYLLLIALTIIKYLAAWQLFHALKIHSLSGKYEMGKHLTCMTSFILNIVPGGCILIAWEELWFLLVTIFPE